MAIHSIPFTLPIILTTLNHHFHFTHPTNMNSSSSSFPNFIHCAILFLSFYTFLSPSSLALSNDIVSLLAFKSKADLHNNKLTSYSYANTSSLCKWQGVLECNQNGKITRLVLENLNLSGVFPANSLARLDQLRVLSLRNNSLHGPVPDLSGLVNIKALFLDQNHFTGVIPLSISSLHRLRTLDLSFNKFSGGIPVGLSKLDRLNYIRLDSNRLNGTIPHFNQSSLEVFNVSVNFLSGNVPVTRALARFGPGSFSNNPGLCGKIVRIECGPVSSKNSTGKQSSLPQAQQMKGITNSGSLKKKRIGLIVGFCTCLFLAIVSALCVLMLVKKSETKKTRKGVNEMMEMAEAADAAAEVMRMEEANELEKKVRKLHQGIAEKKSGLLVFSPGESQVYTVEQLMRASAELLGSGTMGTTYKALVDGRVIVCVKRLDATKFGGITNEAFERHMEVVGTLRHPNVVALEAYFHMKEEKLLVYEFQQNGSLFSLIHGSKSTRARPLHWTSCLKIAEDVAQGLSYLHQTHNLVHGNLKASNVLLGNDFEALITDYSLSALLHCLPSDTNRDFPAYNAPEIEPHNEPTATSDVYSFGILLLELLTGKAVSSDHQEMSPDEVVKWVKLSRENDGGGMMEEKRLEMMTEVAIACSNVSSPERRPTMWQVIKMLQEIKEAAVMEDCSGLDPASRIIGDHS